MDKKIIYVLQGGGALGSFQLGGVKALFEREYHPNMIVGISIGAINAAIIAGNPNEKVVDKLNLFWDLITEDNIFSSLLKHHYKLNNYFGAQKALFLGQKNFYKPKHILHVPLIEHNNVEKLSYYDISPLKDTLKKVIDFNYINEKHKRLCVGATNLRNGDFVFFDNYKEEIKIEHILASGALPPAFPAVKIDNEYYVDGGVYANTPLTKVLDEFENDQNDIKDNLAFMFDLFSADGVLPHSMDGMLERIKDIQYSSHSKRTTHVYSTVQNLSKAIKLLGKYIPEEFKNKKEIQEVLKLGNVNNLDLVHIIYKSKKGTELESKDYNFSKQSMKVHLEQGYNETISIINEDSAIWNQKGRGLKIHTLDNNEILEEK